MCFDQCGIATSFQSNAWPEEGEPTFTGNDFFTIFTANSYNSGVLYLDFYNLLHKCAYVYVFFILDTLVYIITRRFKAVSLIHYFQILNPDSRRHYVSKAIYCIMIY